uniref:Uncharacterized protein n=1 Tax=Rhizophora mucronata TaxID=61149 RepID=A0A2P2QCE3_RHIMU
MWKIFHLLHNSESNLVILNLLSYTYCGSVLAYYYLLDHSTQGGVVQLRVKLQKFNVHATTYV